MNAYKARLSKSVLLPQIDASHLIPLIPLIDTAFCFAMAVWNMYKYCCL